MHEYIHEYIHCEGTNEINRKSNRSNRTEQSVASSMSNRCPTHGAQQPGVGQLRLVAAQHGPIVADAATVSRHARDAPAEPQTVL